MGKPRIHYAILLTTPDTQAVIPIEEYLRLPLEALRYARVALIPYEQFPERFSWLRGKRRGRGRSAVDWH